MRVNIRERITLIEVPLRKAGHAKGSKQILVSLFRDSIK